MDGVIAIVCTQTATASPCGSSASCGTETMLLGGMIPPGVVESWTGVCHALAPAGLNAAWTIEVWLLTGIVQTATASSCESRASPGDPAPGIEIVTGLVQVVAPAGSVALSMAFEVLTQITVASPRASNATRGRTSLASDATGINGCHEPSGG
jgi:hypothetical protein